MVLQNIEKIASELSEIERLSLACFSQEKSFSVGDVVSCSHLPADSVRRALAWLAEKEILSVSESPSRNFFLSDSGKSVVVSGLPEMIFLSALRELGGRASFSDLMKKTNFSQQEFNIALGINKKKAFVSIVSSSSGIEVQVTDVDKEVSSPFPEFDFLKSVSSSNFSSSDIDSSPFLNLFLSRGLIEFKDSVSRSYSLTSFGVSVSSFLASGKIKRVFDLSAPVPEIFIGKKQPYVQFLSSIRYKLVQLGFSEMYSPLIVSEFYNFDVLFQPQNHSAREWTDTYQLKQPSFGSLPNKKVVSAVKSAHESGGVSASSGWGYDWSEQIAKKLMPAAHATAHSARQLVSGVDVPKKYFSIARCFRPDVFDSTHLIEFNQLDGFVVGEDISFRHLLGLLKQFAIEVAGASKVRFFPDYYPFTEPSVQLSAKHPDLGWIEFAGAGMFRPEILENLGISERVIAWGMGIDRLAMFKLGVSDIRHLFSYDLNYLRSAKLLFDLPSSSNSNSSNSNSFNSNKFVSNFKELI